MSFLIDPPWLYANGRAYAALAPERAQGRTAAAVGAATMAVFWGVSVSLYLNRPWTRRIWRLCRAARRPRLDAQLGRPADRPPRGRAATHAVSAALFATYPLWLWLGWRDGRRA